MERKRKEEGLAARRDEAMRTWTQQDKRDGGTSGPLEPAHYPAWGREINWGWDQDQGAWTW
ncbi:hypothetical protein VCV18_008864 [Metarhizium anisopliae]